MNTSPAHILNAIAEVKAQTLASLCGNDFDDADDFDSMFAQALLSQIPDMNSVSVGVLSALVSSSALHAGRNMALPDPESAYRMMTLINGKDSLYKAQVHELSEMGKAVAGMQQAGQRLSNIAVGHEDIEAGLKDFVAQYNDWIRRFAPDMGGDGLLAGTQAAQLSRYELEQSVRNMFIGVGEGLSGIDDIGVTVASDGTLSLDESKLDAMLASNMQAVVGATREFGASFARAAEMLNARNNFIANQLDNLNRAIRYIGDNHAAWQAEFGAGDAAKPAGQVAKALAAYKQAGGV
ncbi:MAG: flagellar filament capping protein FliD [Gallionella sp.]|jgi:hypothetical protein|nr:flagellar filament capping protein FliD [Gallionella sp.]MCK9355397.1 flagellar filament capping protein FliD [Gallionella sp.]